MIGWESSSKLKQKVVVNVFRIGMHMSRSRLEPRQLRWDPAGEVGQLQTTKLQQCIYFADFFLWGLS